MILFCFHVVNILKSLFSLVYENDQFHSTENKFQDKKNGKRFSFFCLRMFNLMTKKTKKTQQRKITTMEIPKWEGRGLKVLWNKS